MASSPLRSPTGEPPQSPQSFHSPLQSPSHEPVSSGNHSIPPSSLNNYNNKTNSLPRSPTSESLQSPIPRSQNNSQSPSRGTVPSGNNHLNSQSSPFNNKNNTINSPIRSPLSHPASLNHLSVPHSPSNNNVQENHKESQPNNIPILSPKLYPLHLRASKPSIQIQPPSFNSLTESEPSPSSLAITLNPINDGNKRANFDEEAIDSPLRTVNLDRTGGPGRVTGSGGGGNTVVAEAVWRAEVRRVAVFLRVLAAVLCLVSFSVMAADRTKGWDGDSYRRYEEYRYVRNCFLFNLSINVHCSYLCSCFGNRLMISIYSK